MRPGARPFVERARGSEHRWPRRRMGNFPLNLVWNHPGNQILLNRDKNTKQECKGNAMQKGAREDRPLVNGGARFS